MCKLKVSIFLVMAIIFCSFGFGYAEAKETVVIAVIDSGIIHHEIFENYVDFENGYNFLDDNENVIDTHGHGTMVSSVIVDKIKNYGNIIILPIKVTKDTGKAENEDVIKAIEYAVRRNVDIINLSLGSSTSRNDLNEAIQNAVSQGIIFVGGRK